MQKRAKTWGEKASSKSASTARNPRFLPRDGPSFSRSSWVEKLRLDWFWAKTKGEHLREENCAKPGLDWKKIARPEIAQNRAHRARNFRERMLRKNALEVKESNPSGGLATTVTSLQRDISATGLEESLPLPRRELGVPRSRKESLRN